MVNTVSLLNEYHLIIVIWYGDAVNKISDLFGRRIYSETSDFIGTAKDVLIDPAEGKIKFLLKEDAGSILRRNRDEAKKFIKENFIPFESVKAVGDIIIVR